jgi:hypothetical protein
VDELEQDSWARKHRALNAALCELVQDYSLVAFTTLNIMASIGIVFQHEI